MAGGRIKTGILISLILLLGIVAAAALYFYQVLFKSPYFMPGVRIASIEVAGYTAEQAAARLQKDMEEYKNTPVTFYYEDYSYAHKLEEISYPVNYKAEVDKVWQEEQQRNWRSKLANLDGSREVNYPLKLEYKTEIKALMVDDWDKNLGVAAEDARLDMDKQKGLVSIPAKKGLKVDSKRTFAHLPREWGSTGEIKVPITMIEEMPQVKDEDLSNMGELSSFSTWFNESEINRSHNLYLATAAINGAMLSPGEVFSFNRRVGERVIEAGYRDALVIVNGKFEPGLGGGVCQVSSTLYNTVLLAGMEIVERYNHALAVAYVPVGRDATVVYGVQDFRFKNNSPYPVYIRAWAQAGKLSMTVYGNLAKKRNIQLSTIVDRSIPFKEIRENDPDLSPGEEKVDHAGVQGYAVRSFRNYMDEEGRLLKSEQLASDYYKPLDKLIYVGSGVKPEVAPGDGNKPEDFPHGDETDKNDPTANNSGEGLPLPETEPTDIPDSQPDNGDVEEPTIML